MIKIIDLLNKIANGEEIPKRIKFNGSIYSYHDKEHGYCRSGGDCTYICLNSEYNLFDILNDEVEIIEEENKIEKIKKVVCDSDLIDRNHFVIEYLAELKHKINEIIDKLNELGDKENDKN